MLRASAHDGKGRRTLIFGLEPENIIRLKKGRPIHLNAKELGVDCDVVIFAGDTPEEMARQLGGATILDANPKGSS